MTVKMNQDRRKSKKKSRSSAAQKTKTSASEKKQRRSNHLRRSTARVNTKTKSKSMLARGRMSLTLYHCSDQSKAIVRERMTRQIKSARNLKGKKACVRTFPLQSRSLS